MKKFTHKMISVFLLSAILAAVLFSFPVTANAAFTLSTVYGIAIIDSDNFQFPMEATVDIRTYEEELSYRGEDSILARAFNSAGIDINTFDFQNLSAIWSVSGDPICTVESKDGKTALWTITRAGHFVICEELFYNISGDDRLVFSYSTAYCLFDAYELSLLFDEAEELLNGWLDYTSTACNNFKHALTQIHEEYYEIYNMCYDRDESDEPEIYDNYSAIQAKLNSLTQQLREAIEELKSSAEEPAPGGNIFTRFIEWIKNIFSSISAFFTCG